MTESDAIPVQPFRTHLYDPTELLAGFAADDDLSYTLTHDFAVYRAWIVAGSAHCSHVHAIAQAIHDSSITEALDDWVADRRLVGIMGGHRMARSPDPASPYARVARLARTLSRNGMTPVSGGGPGAMEATHLGARTAGLDLDDVQAHLQDLATAAAFPEGMGELVARDGKIDLALVRRLHQWQAPAFRVWDATARQPGESLGIPTWHYGHEPPTPLATHIAKYFQNSVREDGLLAIARHGVVFFPGAAGTVQEVFQDATQNYYGLHGLVSPMVFVGVDHWTRVLPVWPVVQALFTDHEMLHLTDDVDDACDFLAAHPPRPA
ncbi:MAG TPA: LOG family protein [Nitriliruptoraceae bacterium]|nr:LOG family protein [Nitriliruptoraceae bacterium]